MTGALLFWLALAALALASFAAIGAHALRDFSRAQLRELLRRLNLEPRYHEVVEHHQRAALGADSLRVVAAAAAVIAATGFLWNSHLAELAWPLALAMTLAYIVVGAVALWLAILWLPAAISLLWAEPFLARTWSFWKATGKILAPSVVGAQFVERALHRIAGKQPQPLTEEDLEEEIREVVSEGQREGLLEEDAREMIESVISLGEVMVSEIMTPRTDMISMSVDLPWEEALQLAVSSGHTRIPVYRKSRDNVIGILHMKDLLPELVSREQAPRRPLAELLRPPFFVPESKAVDELLQEFQQSRSHLAVVLDEYGGVSGLVTIEDVLEEIVGEIADEHDEAVIDGIKPLGPNACEAFARVRIDELNEQLELHLPENEHYDTIGGLVFHELGRIPHAGEELVAHGVKIKVLEATRRRINRVAIEMLPPEEAMKETSSESGVRSAE